MRNKGKSNKGFMICPDCGAAIAGDEVKGFYESEKGLHIERPYRSMYRNNYPCKHNNAKNFSLGFDFITDMLVIEIVLDDDRINKSVTENPWIIRAARSLAEALRLQTSVLLDIEFTELNAGYRLRQKDGITYIDVYLYDSLSSGAGYSSGIALQIEELLQSTEKFLNSCNCENACQECLKHYRNYIYHSHLDRFSALQLMNWAKDGEIARPIIHSAQEKMVSPFVGILDDYGINVAFGKNVISLERKDSRQLTLDEKMLRLTVYPAMLVKPRQIDTVFISDFEARYSRAYAVDSIKDVLGM